MKVNLFQQYGEWESAHHWICPVLFISDILLVERHEYSLTKVIQNGCGKFTGRPCVTCSMRSVE